MTINKKCIKLVFLFSFLLLHFVSPAQRKREIKYSGFFDSFYFPGPFNYTIGAGYALYNGDLCGKFGCNNLNLGYSGGVNYRILPHIFVGGEVQYLTLGAKDENQMRNLTFQSSILQLTPYGRYYFIDDIIRVARDRAAKPKILKPYFHLGASLIYILSASSTYDPQVPESSQLPEESPTKIAFGIPAG